MKHYELLRLSGSIVEVRLDGVPVASAMRAQAGPGVTIVARRQGISLSEVLEALELADERGFWAPVDAAGLPQVMPSRIGVDVQDATDGWRLFAVEARTYRARLRPDADPALWPAAHVEAEHSTPDGWRGVLSPGTLIALHRLLTGRPHADVN